MVTTTLGAKQQKRHRYKEQTFWALRKKARVGWFERIALKICNLKYVCKIAFTICKIDDQSMFSA